MGDGVLRWGPCAFHGHCRSADGTPSVVRRKGFVFGIQSSLESFVTSYFLLLKLCMFEKNSTKSNLNLTNLLSQK